MNELIEKDKYRYNSDYKLIYKAIEDNDKSETQYRCDFLKVFGLDVFDDDIVFKSQRIVFDKIKENKSFINIFKKVKKNKYYGWLTHDQEDYYSFVVLFNYDLFHLAHQCLKDYFSINDISEESYKNIINALEN
tara:strand:- start:272 stop:673 length:402 start_codon:yes stop_codon:yes gene_type:complete